MQPLSTPKFIAKRLADDWRLLLSIFLGVTIAASLVAGAPVYLRALERLGVNTAIDRASNVFLNIHIFAPNIPLTEEGIGRSEQTMENVIQRSVAEPYRGRRRYLKGATYLVGLPSRPLPENLGASQSVARGYFQYLEDLDQHIRFLDGRMARDEVRPGPRGPVLEAVIGAPSAELFGLQVGDLVVATPFLAHDARVTAEIVGILEPTNPTEEYWRNNSDVFLFPQPSHERPEIGVSVSPDEPQVAMFATKRAMIDGVGGAYPGSLVDTTWFLFLDKEGLKEWSIDETHDRLRDMEVEITKAMPGSIILTGISKMLDEFERRSFFSSVPLLLLLTLMVVTVLYYLAMMVSYLVQSREGDVALLRTRGVGTLQLLRLYAIEGFVLMGVAVVAAPFLAMGAIAVAGKLPYFVSLTGGEMLPVEMTGLPFLVALGAGLLSLAIYIVPGVVGARSGLVVHKLRSSRPPTVPVFQRYYLDVGLLCLGGIIFWELYSRGHLISGGLFKDVQVNEALLLAPVLFLVVVALLFMRFFPLIVRYISGESPVILHLLAAASILVLGAGTILRDTLDGQATAWLVPVALLLGVAVTYWATRFARRPPSLVTGLLLQAAFIAWFLVIEPPHTGEVLFAPSVALIALVPGQVGYFLLRGLTQRAPVWVSMGLWHMARNPLQYSWLVLLLVLVTGLGILATTVGGTLSRSNEERVLYNVGSDIRVSGIEIYSRQSTGSLREEYLTIPGVTSVSLGLRESGSVGSTLAGAGFQLLGVESQNFPYMSWYREDFSDRSLAGVMRALQSAPRADDIILPEGTTHLSAWVNPAAVYSNISLWLVIQDGRGITNTISLGPIGRPGWHVLSAEVPPRLEPPLDLVAVQIYEPGFGPTGTVGSILLDDIYATVNPGRQTVVLEDFDRRRGWTTLATSKLASDRLSIASKEALRGNGSALFSFGKDTDRGIRGFFRGSTAGAIPVVASTTFTVNNGVSVGDGLIIDVSGRLILVVIRDTVDYFPTLSPYRGGFVLADLDTVLSHLRMLSPAIPVMPNELFLTVAPNANDTVLQGIERTVGRTGSIRIFDKGAQLESVRLDPLVTAGWKAMVLLSLAIIVFTAGLGYVTYLLSFSDRHRTEIGFLRTLGLSRRQMIGLLGLEHVVVIVLGMGLGTWAGFQMSKLMVRSVAVTERGDSILPPFILGTDWSFMLPIYALLFLIFAVALLALNRSVLRADLHAILRAEG